MKILTAYCEEARGPGWSNSVLWVVYEDVAGTIREYGIQPEDQPPAVQHLFRVAAAVQRELVAAARLAPGPWQLRRDRSCCATMEPEVERWHDAKTRPRCGSAGEEGSEAGPHGPRR